MKMNANEREARIGQIRTTRARKNVLRDVYLATWEGSPADTVAELVDRLGYDAARETVAELINMVGDWDGRVWDYVREWAQNVPNAASREELDSHGIYQPTDIHPAHINQIGQAMRDYTPTDVTPANVVEDLPDPERVVELIRALPTARSAWGRGVREYAVDLARDLVDQVRGGYVTRESLTDWTEVRRVLLNGAADWLQYSWGGCTLCYDQDIAARLCSPSEYRRKRGGELRPNAREEWLDVQARALGQAARIVESQLAASAWPGLF